MCMCLSTCICALCMESSRVSGESSDSLELPLQAIVSLCGCWEPNCSPPQRQYALFLLLFFFTFFETRFHSFLHCPGIHCVAQAGLEATEFLVQVCLTTAASTRLHRWAVHQSAPWWLFLQSLWILEKEASSCMWCVPPWEPLPLSAVFFLIYFCSWQKPSRKG